MRLVTSSIVHPWNCDVQGHLNTRHYVGIFDDANQILLARIAGKNTLPDQGWADVRNELDFLAEITAGTAVDVFAAIRRIGTKSLTIAAELRRANSDDSCARMLAIITRFDLTARRAVPLSQPLIESARPWLEAAPAAT
jgi:acyl-CoA thioester hydrolase